MVATTSSARFARSIALLVALSTVVASTFSVLRLVLWSTKGTSDYGFWFATCVCSFVVFPLAAVLGFVDISLSRFSTIQIGIIFLILVPAYISSAIFGSTHPVLAGAMFGRCCMHIDMAVCLGCIRLLLQETQRISHACVGVAGS